MGSIMKQIRRYVESGDVKLEEADGVFKLTMPEFKYTKHGQCGLWMKLLTDHCPGANDYKTKPMVIILKKPWLNPDRIAALRYIINSDAKEDTIIVPNTKRGEPL